MAESNATQVILTDDGIKIIKAQNTADNATGGVDNLNDPNLMSVIEKQTQASQYAGLTSQYNVILKRAKDANISTTDLTTAYTNLSTFMASILTDTDKASDVDRDTYKSLTDAYNTALSNVQAELSNSFNTDISNMQSNVSVASQAASSAVIVASQAATTGDNASHVASQAAVVASQAQIAGNNATSVANNASQAASSAVIAGSTATVNADKAITAASQAKSAGDNATVVANNASQAASSAILAGSTATVNANKAISAASQAQTTGNNATSVANNASQAASAAVIAGSTAAVSADKAFTAASQAQIAVDSAASVANRASSDASKAIFAGSQAASSAKSALETAQNTAKKYESLGMYKAWANTSPENQNMNSWVLSDPAKKAASITYENGVNTIDYTGVPNYEVFSMPIHTKVGNKVSVTFSYTQPAVLSLDGSSNGVPVSFSDQPEHIAMGDNPMYLGVNAQNSKVYTISTTATSKTMYLSFNFGYLRDGINWKFELSVQQDMTIKQPAVMSEYIGFSNKQSDNPADYTWLRNPDELEGEVQNQITIASNNAESKMVQTINSVGVGFKNPDGTTYTMYLTSDGTALLDFNKIMLNGQTNIQSGTIGTAQIANAAITDAKIGNEAVGTAQIKDAAINSAKIAKLAVGTAQIGDGAITNAKIGSLAVGTAQIADGAITNAQIGSLAVGTAQIKDEAVNSSKIAKLAVGTAQIGDGAITNAKIGHLAVGTAQIANGAITDAQIGSLAVGTAQIKNEAVNSSKIANLAVGTAQIGDGAITNAKIGKLAVGTAQIANAAITDAQVGNVSANKLTAGTIDFNTITGKNINASNITTGTLNTNRLNVGKLSALSANLGDVTTGSLKGVDIVAKTFSTPNGSFTTDANGALTAKNMTLMGGTLTSPTINASTINGSTINGTTFNAGTRLNSYGNTNYPLTISSDGSVDSTISQNNNGITDILRTRLKDGKLITNFRRMNPYETGKYLAADTILGIGQLELYQGYSSSADANFSANSLHATGYTILDSGTGLNLHGDTQQITFNGTSADATPKGIIITPYGNINPNGTQNIWYVGNNMSMKTASFGMDADQNVPISLSRQTLVDEIGAMGNRLSMGRLLLHAVDGNAQMYLLNDGKPAFVSPTIYNRTYSYGANMFVTSAGRVGRSTSASKYKLAITRSDDTTQADRLMTLNPASWNDKVATEKMAESLSNGEIPVESEINLKRHYGLIAEDLRDAGLDEFLITGKDGQIEGIEYDRLWTVLIPKIKQLNNRINELERKTL
ncbi:beta strand repeat-containing protein [Lactiplantibacillus plantarum]|uniref:Peptidase S74 domain-containing protein n=1 Tax=Lactiplantibacillus plantarum 2025 TaxID=1385856 RepID=A0A837NKA2_LACPN|nr:hypothetical protein [Lactiplantibacillus plantarum]